MNKLLLIAALLAGCDMPEQKPYPVADQCMRAEIFKSCMSSLPAGPVSTKYNDWNEVVDSCEEVAYYQSLRAPSLIRAECKT